MRRDFCSDQSAACVLQAYRVILKIGRARTRCAFAARLTAPCNSRASTRVRVHEKCVHAWDGVRSPSDRVITRALHALRCMKRFPDLAFFTPILSASSSRVLASVLFSLFRLAFFLFLTGGERVREEEKTVKVYINMYTQIDRERVVDSLPIQHKVQCSSFRWKSVSSPEGYNLRDSETPLLVLTLAFRAPGNLKILFRSLEYLSRSRVSPHRS